MECCVDVSTEKGLQEVKFYTVVKKNFNKTAGFGLQSFVGVILLSKNYSPKRQFFEIVFHYGVKFNYL